MLISGWGMHAAIYMYIYTHLGNTPKIQAVLEQRWARGGERKTERKGEWRGRRLSPQHTTDVSANHLIRREVREKVALLCAWMIPYVMCSCTAREQDIYTYFVPEGAAVPFSDSEQVVFQGARATVVLLDEKRHTPKLWPFIKFPLLYPFWHLYSSSWTVAEQPRTIKLLKEL